MTVPALLLALLAAHVLGDFVLQTDRTARGKRSPGVLLAHAAIVSALSYLACGLWSEWRIPLAVFVAHAAIDAVKARAGASLAAFLTDQAAHVASLLAVAAWLDRPAEELAAVALWGDAYLNGLIVLTGGVVAVLAAGSAITLAVRPLVAQLESTDARDAARGRRRGFEHGGRLIGRLERALIFLFVLAGQPAAIGFLIAAKSIFRFGELKDAENRMEAEYILIGTLMSFGAGAAAAFATRWALGVAWL